MIFIGGISQGSKILQYAGSLMCKYCGSLAQCQVIMTYYYFSFFFIPLFKWNKRFFVKMSCCEAVYELNPEVGRAIARGEQVEIRNEDLKLAEDGKRHYGAYGQAAAQDQQGDQIPDPEKTLRCPICKHESPGNFKYCPMCGQRLQ
ncbi:MAG: zinc ribbon domain-containing protein [Lachnospiraceae bacterium]|nr:zinc ribbon domain-containing protein [Lachnospiraceae bacterium]MDO5551587.1 zinc ribbon domain-containing protein [Lachnospiraceae bacterium]